LAKQFLTPLIAKLLTGLSLPTSPSDAANKQYVDSVAAPTEHTIVAPFGTVTELMRTPVSGIESLLVVVDIKPPSGVGESYHSFLKPDGAIVHDTCFAQIGEVSYVNITYIISGTDLVATVINTSATDNVVVTVRLV